MPKDHDAIVFVPGMGHHWSDQSLETIARKMVIALNLLAKQRGMEFASETRVEVDNVPGMDGQNQRKICTVGIEQGEGQPIKPIFDLYEYDYRKPFLSDLEQKPLGMKILILFLTALRSLPRTVLALFSGSGKTQDTGNYSTNYRKKRAQGGKSWQYKLQALYILIIYIILCFYFVSLIINALQLVFPALNSPSPDTPGADWLTAFWGALDVIFVGVTAGNLVIKTELRKLLTDTATSMVSMINYLDAPDPATKNFAIGEFEALLDKIYDEDYKRCHIMAYSFGSILALDTLYTQDDGPHLPAVTRVDSIITIGSPFDMIRTFWPAYFDERNVPDVDADPKHQLHWINVYLPHDLLGSNFRNDDNDNDESQPRESFIWNIDALAHGPKPDVNINCAQGQTSRNNQIWSRVWRWITLMLLRTHTEYWGGDERPRDCFRYIMLELYGDILNPPPIELVA